MDYLEQLALSHPAWMDAISSMSQFYEKKLWHQLTMELNSFLSANIGDFHNDEERKDFYTKFISSFQHRLNPVKFVLLVSKIGHSFTESSGTLDLFESILTSSKEKLGLAASVCLEMDIVTVNIILGQLEKAKASLENTKDSINGKISSSETAPFSKYYKAYAEYYKKVGPATEFYKKALLFLAYTPVDDLTSSEKYAIATDIALSSICGEDIYNFGEVLATPVLESLKETDNAFLYDLIVALNRGIIDEFNVLVDSNNAKIATFPALQNNLEDIKKKLVLLALMNIAFERSSHDRQIGFDAIASRIQIDISQVEDIIMRAMSLGLIKGYMDQVDQYVNITWVQPRVLETVSLQVVSEQLGEWTERVKTTLVTVEEQTSELFC
jgi:26S proteasome regulatory subunit N9